METLNDKVKDVQQTEKQDSSELSPIEDESKKKIKEDITLSSSLEWAKFNVLPIFIFLFFIAMAVFFTVPEVQRVFEGFDQIEELRGEYNSNQDTITKLESLREQQLENAQLLNVVDEVVPSESTRVVSYRDQMVDIARESGLSIQGTVAGETIRLNQDLVEIGTSTDEIIDELHLVVIPITLEANGTISAFEEFLVNLYTSYDFFVVEEMEIINNSGIDFQENQEDDEWSATLTIVKYQFGGIVDISDVTLENYVDLANQQPNQTVVNFIEEKFSRREDSLAPNN